MNKSEVAHIRAQMSAEQESAHRALHSLAYGTAQHSFITRRMERIGALHGALKGIVGDDQAAQVLYEAMEGQKPKGEN